MTNESDPLDDDALDDIVSDFEMPEVSCMSPGHRRGLRPCCSIQYGRLDELPALVVVESKIVSNLAKQFLKLFALWAAGQKFLKSLEAFLSLSIAAPHQSRKRRVFSDFLYQLQAFIKMSDLYSDEVHPRSNLALPRAIRLLLPFRKRFVR